MGGPAITRTAKPDEFYGNPDGRRVRTITGFYPLRQYAAIPDDEWEEFANPAPHCDTCTCAAADAGPNTTPDFGNTDPPAAPAS